MRENVGEKWSCLSAARTTFSSPISTGMVAVTSSRPIMAANLSRWGFVEPAGNTEALRLRLGGTNRRAYCVIAR